VHHIQLEITLGGLPLYVRMSFAKENGCLCCVFFKN
jgi:hypothetical protein